MSSGNFQACTTLTEDEAMIQESVRRWAQEELAPHVREMDRDSKMKDEIIHGLFENGFMGVEVEAEHGSKGALSRAQADVAALEKAVESIA